MTIHFCFNINFHNYCITCQTIEQKGRISLFPKISYFLKGELSYLKSGLIISLICDLNALMHVKKFIHFEYINFESSNFVLKPLKREWKL